MTDTHPQNRDPFVEAFAPLYQEGRLIDVPAGLNAHDRETRRAELVKERVVPARSREETLAELQVERDRAAEFLAKADRALGKASPASALSATVDNILAEEGVDFDDDADEIDWDGAA